MDVFDNMPMTLATSESTFSALRLLKNYSVPKKHHEAGLPEQLPTDLLSQIDYWHTIHCEDCKEVCLRQRTTQRAFWNICVGVCTWLSGRKASQVSKHSAASDMCCSKLLLPWTTRVKYSLGGTYVHTEVAWHYLQSNKQEENCSFSNKTSQQLHYWWYVKYNYQYL